MNETTRSGAAVALAMSAILVAGCSAGGPINDSGSSGNSGSSGSSGNSGGSSTPAVTAPSIVTQPADASVITGNSATFTVVATGTRVTFAWKRNGIVIPGATSASYTTPAAAWGDDDSEYTVVATNSAGSATSTTAVLRLALSDDQKAYESLLLAENGGSFYNSWFLNYVGSQNASFDYLQAQIGALEKSPLTNGPQTTIESAPVSLASTLPAKVFGPSRVLKNGQILVIPGAQYAVTTSYSGSSIQEDTLADDNATVAYSEIRSGFAQHALSGALSGSPAEFEHSFNSVFGNPLVLDQTRAWDAGAAYVTFHEVLKGDRYWAYDCTGATTGKDLSPCMSGTTLAAALTTGLVADGTTYHLGDGAISSVGGVQVWIATAKRPYLAIGSATDQYRIYFQMGNNVYTGALTKDGAVIAGNGYRTDPTTSASTVWLDYRLRINKAANESLAAALRI